MSKLRIGERYAYYSASGRKEVTLVTVCLNGLVQLKEDLSHSSTFFDAHPKQIRKIKPKREPRRIWVRSADLDIVTRENDKSCASAAFLFPKPDQPTDQIVEFQEVLPKNKKK